MSMLSTIAPKSDQLNADDLIGGITKTIKITKVSILAGDQPVALNFEGDNGKPYKPCKSMRRVLVHCWGGDGNVYIGRSLVLYRDDKVKFGGAEVGGIRISHMSDIDGPITMALTATRAARKPYTVKPLVAQDAADEQKYIKAIERVQAATSEEELNIAVEESRKIKGWSKGAAAQMKEAIDAQRALFRKPEREPGDDMEGDQE